MKILAQTDNAKGGLDANINASVLVVPLKSGEGALFPTTINGSATGAGDKNNLPSTGVLALGVTAGMLIENVSDGSVCAVVSVSTDAVITTDLRGGTLNVWGNSDKWAIGRFIVTLERITTSIYGVETVTQLEKILIKSRSGDNLTVETSGRGYDGSGAKTWLADERVSLHSMSAHHEDLKELIVEQALIIYALQSGKADMSAVLALLQAITWKDPVKASSTADVDITSELENGDVIDGVTLATGDRVLLKDQTATEENGVYVVVASGTASRSEDMDAWGEFVSCAIIIEEGTLNKDQFYLCIADEGGTLETTPIVFNVIPNQYADQAEAEAGIENTKIMTALRVKQSIDANLQAGQLYNNHTAYTTNQGSETTMFSYTLPANTLRVNDKIIVKLAVSSNIGVPATTVTAKLKFGGTLVGTLTFGQENVSGYLVAEIQNANSLSSQKAYSRAEKDDTGRTLTTPAIDTTSSVAIIATIQTTGTPSFSASPFIVEVVRQDS